MGIRCNRLHPCLGSAQRNRTTDHGENARGTRSETGYPLQIMVHMPIVIHPWDGNFEALGISKKKYPIWIR